MEMRNVGKVNPARGYNNLLLSGMGFKKLGGVIRRRKANVFTCGFLFGFIVCSVYLALIYPSGLVINPILIQRQSWLFHFSTDNSSSSAFISFILGNPAIQKDANSNKINDIKPKGKHRKENPEKPRNHLDSSGETERNNNQISSIIGYDQKKENVQQHRSLAPLSSASSDGYDDMLFNSGSSEKNKPMEDIISSPARNKDSNNAVKLGATDPFSIQSADQLLLPRSNELKQCNIFYGKWIKDKSYPQYPAGSCPFIDESFDCFRNRRPDNEYEHWKWQPNDCNIPRLNATDMLERLRDKRLVFVGDSLNRNMWESMVCILRHSVQNKEQVYEISGKSDFKKEGFYAFRFEDYNCSVEFVRAPFLVQEWERPTGNGTTKDTLRLDLMDSFVLKYKDADIIVFNTGHWWTHEKTSQGKDYYQEGDHVFSQLNVLEAFRKAIKTWGHWVDDNIDANKTSVFFRGYSASHFSGGQWNSGGQCHNETQPIFKETYLKKYPSMMNVLESVIKEMRTPITYLNITRITDYRKDGHPSIYRKQSLSQEKQLAPELYQDCSHWCLPGIPDTWNELLYASLHIARWALS